MKILYAVLVCCFSMAFVVPVMAEEKKVDGHLIPQDVMSRWDLHFKVMPFLGVTKSASKIPECKTYEELRDTLKLLIAEIKKANVQ